MLYHRNGHSDIKKKDYRRKDFKKKKKKRKTMSESLRIHSKILNDINFKKNFLNNFETGLL